MCSRPGGRKKLQKECGDNAIGRSMVNLPA
jgi:hypothetical protein